MIIDYLVKGFLLVCLGGCSLVLDQDRLQRPLVAPKNVTARLGDGAVLINWNQVQGADSYNIYWKNSPGVSKSDAVISGVDPGFIHEGLANGMPYYYAVTSVNVHGESGLSAEAMAKPGAARTDCADCDPELELETEYCNYDCTVSICGDGKINRLSGEDCDDRGPSAYCTSDCECVAGKVCAVMPEMVGDILFFESSEDITPREERDYDTEFSASSARFIAWELTLNHPGADRTIDFTIDVIYRSSDGDILTDYSVDARIEPSWNASYFDDGYGSDEPGHWDPDTYSVELSTDGVFLGRAFFRIR